MIQTLFDLGVAGLIWLAELTGTTYKEINILVYFIAFPLVWAILLDFAFRQKKLTVYAIATILIATFWLGNNGVQIVYDTAVAFEYWLSFLGWDYYEASVYTCVHAPIIISVGVGIIFIWKRFIGTHYNLEINN